MQTDTVMHIKQFIRENLITMTAEQVDRNPNMDNAEMDHWKVVLTRTATETGTFVNPRRGTVSNSRTYAFKMTTHFSMGHGRHGKAPEAADVLDCLTSGASSVDNARSFEDFASELGYDPDSRKAEKIYKACQHGAARLKKFLGDDLYQELLYNVERM